MQADEIAEAVEKNQRKIVDFGLSNFTILKPN
jgi:predicted oxidoreductase